MEINWIDVTKEFMVVNSIQFDYILKRPDIYPSLSTLIQVLRRGFDSGVWKRLIVLLNAHLNLERIFS